MKVDLDTLTGLNEIYELAYRILCDECETTKCCASGTDSCETDLKAASLSDTLVTQVIASNPISTLIVKFGRPWQ